MNHKLIGVIPVAGKGLRLLPHTEDTPKPMLKVGGKTILERNICILRDKLHISTIYILVGYKKEHIMEYFKNGESLGVDLRYIEIEDVDKGLAWGILQTRHFIKDTFCVILGDEMYCDSNHEDLCQYLSRDFSAVCAFKEGVEPQIIKKNYSILKEGERIIALEEKPQKVMNTLLGCGTYLLNTTVFDYITKTPKSQYSKRIEFTDVLGQMVREGEKVLAFPLKGNYININTIEDYNAAQNMLCSETNIPRKVSIVIPAFNEERTVVEVVKRVEAVQLDLLEKEIIVVNDGSNDRTAKVITRELIPFYKNLRYFEHTENKGKGAAIRTALAHCTGDIVLIQDADLEYDPSDYPALLEPLLSKEVKVVYGSRYLHTPPVRSTHSIYKLGGRVITLFLNALYGIRITDEPTCYKVFDAHLLGSIRLECTGFEFCPEVTAKISRLGYRIKEVPISYTPRSVKEGKKIKFKDALIAVFMLTKLRFISTKTFIKHSPTTITKRSDIL